MPFRLGDGEPQFGVLHRTDFDAWQGVAGGVEAGETLRCAARRELQEELGLTSAIEPLPLDTRASIPTRVFGAQPEWPRGLYVVSEHSFAADLTGQDITLSDEHDDILWLDYQGAASLLTFDSNRTALWETRCRITDGLITGQDIPEK